MIEAFVIVEGATEEAFVNELLYPHLFPLGIWPRPIQTGVRRRRNPARGGSITCYRALRNDIWRVLKQHGRRGVQVTTMVDLYALPRDVPGFTTRDQTPDSYHRVQQVEAALERDIADHRFHPYVQLHEFEALLFADIRKLAKYYPAATTAVDALAREVTGFPGPEWIDDGEQTAPSQRIRRRVPGYDKVVAGPLTAIDIGLHALRHRCPHFGRWVDWLEGLAATEA